MKKLIKSVVDIRKGEIPLTLLMVANLYIILVAYYFLKPARDSLFLTKLGADQLPYVFILTALIIVPITSLYNRAGRHLKLNQLATVTTAAVIVCLVGLRFMIVMAHDWVPYTFYVWVSIYGVLMTSQFWLMANAAYDSSQAKRLFPLLGLAAILGAWTGGEVTSFVTEQFNVATENLLFVCMGIMLISIVLTNLTWRLTDRGPEKATTRKRQEERKTTSLRQLFGTIKRSRHLLLIVSIISITMIVASLVDFQFKAVTVQEFPDRADLTSFLGKFYGRLSLVSFLLQLVLTYRFLRILGVGGAIMLLPIGLVLGTGSLLVIPGLISVVLLRGADGSLKYSIDKTGRELLFLPVPLAVKKRTKVFIDMFVDRWARGVAGGLLLLLIYVFDFDADPMGAVRKIGFVVLAFLITWLAMALVMRKEYVNTFRRALEKRDIDPSDIRININEQSTVGALISALSSDNERDLIYALDMLSGTRNKELLQPASSLLDHRSPHVRCRALRLLHDLRDEEAVSKIKTMLDDEDSRVRREAVRFLFDYGGGEGGKLLVLLLNQPEPTVRLAGLAYIVEYQMDEFAYLIDDSLIQSFLSNKGDDGIPGRVEVARVLGGLDLEVARKYLKRILRDPNPEVVNEGLTAIGRLRYREMVPVLIKKLGEKQYRHGALNALTLFGVGVLGTLADYLIDDKVDLIVRRSIPRVIAEIPEQGSVSVLTRCIDMVEPRLKYWVVKALNRLNKKYPDLEFPRQEIDRAMMEETRSYYHVQQILRHCRDTDGDPAFQLLVRALNEKLDQNLEQIFRLLGLYYSPNDMYSAYYGLVSDQRQQQASAIEFLDNLLDHDIRKYLFPIIDETSARDTSEKGTEFFGFKILSRNQALSELIAGNDAWLKACAVYCAYSSKTPEIVEIVKKVRDDSDPVVRETAELITRRWYADKTE